MKKMTFLRWPNFCRKAVTLSYDDGVKQDIRLVKILDEYGLKCTFNINSGSVAKVKTNELKGKLTMEEAVELYTNSAHEVAVHGERHLSLAEINSARACAEVVNDRVALEKAFGKIIRGMAYANGSYSDEVVEILQKCDIAYARTVISTERFDIPTDWLRLPATCHHRNPRLDQLVEEFLKPSPAPRYYNNEPQLFYLWGHSYEFDNDDNWHVIENFCKRMGGHSDIWYATNGEIYDYVKAYESLIYSADGTRIYNPSTTTIYLNYFQREVKIEPGKTVEVQNNF